MTSQLRIVCFWQTRTTLPNKRVAFDIFQDDHGDTPLHDAIIKSKEAAAEVILSWPLMDLHRTNKKGFPPLHLACMKNEPEWAFQFILISKSWLFIIRPLFVVCHLRYKQCIPTSRSLEKTKWYNLQEVCIVMTSRAYILSRVKISNKKLYVLNFVRKPDIHVS